jgi:hypothetical protein
MVVYLVEIAMSIIYLKLSNGIATVLLGNEKKR